LCGVVDFTLSILPRFEGGTELEKLARWANSTRPDKYEDVGVRGFGLAGYQYLRMLFGCQTVKPDAHIRTFVMKIVGHPVSAIETLTLLEKAVERTNITLRELDAAIWEKRAGGHVVYDGKIE
jgi:hypothetical protein